MSAHTLFKAYALQTNITHNRLFLPIAVLFCGAIENDPKRMNVFVFGNSDLQFDSLPLRILPFLKKTCPDVRFFICDPNEEWDALENIIAIDTVEGIASVRLFSDTDEFIRTPRITMHDFDALSNILLLKKIGKIQSIRIIGVPPDMPEDEAAHSVEKIIKTLR